MGSYRGPRASAVLLCCLALLTASCGNRLSREEILAQNGVGGAGNGSGSVPGSGATAGTADPVAGATDPTAGTGTAVASDAGSESNVLNAPGQGGDQPASGGAPIVIGFVGWLGGLGGAGVTPLRDTVLAWSRLVNARGGINGHEVEVLVGDSGGNDARALSIVRDDVENRGAIAIIYADTALGGVAAYAQEHSIPVISTVTVDPAWNQNPYLFPSIANLDANAWARARLARDAGVTKVATMYCSEDPACQAGSDLFAHYAQEEGLQVVYQGRISIAQPDYTAPCLEARGRGAELVFPLADVNSVIRMAQSCGRQNYLPIWSTGGKDSMVETPEFDGVIAAPPGFPWFLRSGAPGIDEYVEALGTYAPHLLTDGTDGQAWAWVAAKILETAAAHVSEQPTSQDILNGLWSMSGETLGGLLTGGAARTFTRDQPTPDTFCVAPARIADGQWVAPNGFTQTCR